MLIYALRIYSRLLAHSPHLSASAVSARPFLIRIEMAEASSPGRSSAPGFSIRKRIYRRAVEKCLSLSYICLFFILVFAFFSSLSFYRSLSFCWSGHVSSSLHESWIFNKRENRLASCRELSNSSHRPHLSPLFDNIIRPNLPFWRNNTAVHWWPCNLDSL